MKAEQQQQPISAVPSESQGGQTVTTQAVAHARMDPELKAKWVAALRSGDYKQVRGAYGGEDIGYCCLGVLAIEAGLGVSPFKEFDIRTTLTCVIGSNVAFHQCVRMNDIEGKTFPEIADWIEENL